MYFFCPQSTSFVRIAKFADILLKFAREKFAESAPGKRIGPLSQIEGASSSVNEEVPGSAFGSEVLLPRTSARTANRTACYTDLLTGPVLGSLPVPEIL